MEVLKFDSGIKEYQLVSGGDVLRFNPSDPNVYARYVDAMEKIKTVEKKMAAKANVIDPSKDDQATGEAILRIMSETDKKMKEILNEVFGQGNDFDKILCGVNLMAVATNGQRVVTNLIDALQPVMESGAKACANEEVDAAKLNREQRRALR